MRLHEAIEHARETGCEFWRGVGDEGRVGSLRIVENFLGSPKWERWDGLTGVWEETWQVWISPSDTLATDWQCSDGWEPTDLTAKLTETEGRLAAAEERAAGYERTLNTTMLLLADDEHDVLAANAQRDAALRRAAEGDVLLLDAVPALLAELRRLREIIEEKGWLGDFAHGDPAECSTCYDGCHCTLSTLEHNIERADKAEAELKRTRDECERMRATIVPTSLVCPNCQTVHIDRGEWETRPHRTHQCQECTLEWRPYGDISTCGVAPPELETFEQAWARMEAQGYQYGEDALQQVRLGFNLARAALAKEGATE